MDLDVERTLELLFPFIVDWHKCKDDNWSYEPVCIKAPTPDYIEKAYEAFDKRWRISEILSQDLAASLD